MQTIKDQLGHEIYLTDERWNHICDEHPEMQGHERKVLETIQRGRRFQDSIRPDMFPTTETLKICLLATVRS
jgi:hypothetical protein